MAAGVVVRARIDANVKDAATIVLAEMGLTVSDAVRLMLVRVARDKSLPFDINSSHSNTDPSITSNEVSVESTEK